VQNADPPGADLSAAPDAPPGALALRLLSVQARVQRLLAWRWTPLALLGALCGLSVGARIWRLDDPFDGTTGNGALIFDEKYYVNAARVLLSLHVACHNDGTGCDPYNSAPGGIDPNAEHPPLGKLFIAAGMKVFGDTPLGWRIAPLIFGTVAIVALYWLVRSAGGGSWLALGAASLMAVDNLSLVHGRIATLDVFVVVFMIAAAALYVRSHPLLAGIALGVGSTVKLVAPFMLLVFGLIEVLRFVAFHEYGRNFRAARPWRRLLPLVFCLAAGAVVYFGLLDVLDLWVKPLHNPNDSCPGSGTTYSNSFVHTAYMLCYAGKLTSPNGPVGIASYPWQWLIDLEPINYYTVNVTVGSGLSKAVHPQVAFQGLMNPAIILLALPAFSLAVADAIRRRDQLAIVATAWALGTFLPFVYESAVNQRTSYLYYMVVVLPAVYILVARLLSRRLPASVLIGYVAILGYLFWWLYPFRSF
jgi:dolichyl-phosphate-mannose-protein mannosyltransferase